MTGKKESSPRSEPDDDCWEDFHARFPYRLHRALSQVEQQGMTHIVSWLPCGSIFRVHDNEAFAKHVMPSIGRFTRYKSFLRQLCIYKFDRVSVGSCKGAFRHPYFRRDHIGLCRAILRGEMYSIPKGCKENVDFKQKRKTIQSDALVTKKTVSRRSTPPRVVSSASMQPYPQAPVIVSLTTQNVSWQDPVQKTGTFVVPKPTEANVFSPVAVGSSDLSNIVIDLESVPLAPHSRSSQDDIQLCPSNDLDNMTELKLFTPKDNT